MSVLRYCSYCAAVAMVGIGGAAPMSEPNEDKPKDLPPPLLAGQMSLEEAVATRRSVRQFTQRSLTLKEISQLCWAGQGITDPGGRFRAAPSAGALYPIELYFVTADGVDHYQPEHHRLRRYSTGDARRPLQQAALNQEAIGDAPVCVVVAAVVKRTARKYGGRAERYCFIEAGHVAQNILLQATALHLAGVPIGAFEDEKVAAVLKLPKDHRVLYLLAIGPPGG
jgi:SagB-type dehydrogenase family enzyme